MITKIVSKLTPWLSLGILFFVAFVSYKLWNWKPQFITNTERITEIRNDTTRHWVDDQGRQHGETRLAQADIAILMAAYPRVDSILRVLDIQGKQLQALTAMSTTTAGSFRPKLESVARGDKTFQQISYKDKWLELDGVITDTPILQYSIYDSFIVSTYWKRKWWLGKKEVFIDAYSLNPASKVNNLTGLKVSTENPKRFGIGPYVGYGWNGREWAPSVGVSLNYSLIRL